MYMQFTMQTGGREWALRWEDGVLSGDPAWVTIITDELRIPLGRIDPVPYIAKEPQIGDPYAVQYVAELFGTIIRQSGDVPRLTAGHPPGTIY